MLSRKFISSYKETVAARVRARNCMQAGVFSGIFPAYRDARRAASPAAAGAGAAGAGAEAAAAVLRQKTRQIEGQQALLQDLQAQLSRKEAEAVEASGKIGNLQREVRSLQAELEKSRKFLEAALAEVERLKAAPVAPAAAPAGAAEAAGTGAGAVVRRACVPRKATRTAGLGQAGASALRLAGSQHGTRTLGVGSTKGVSLAEISGSGNFCASTDMGVAVQALGVTGDGRQAVVGTTEGQLAVFDVQQPQQQPQQHQPQLQLRKSAELKGCQGKVKSCGFLGNRKHVFSASTDRALRIWDVTKATAIKTISVASQLADAAATEDGTLIVTAHQNGKIQIFSGMVGQEQKIGEIEAHADGCVGVAISRTGNLIASIGRDDKIAMIDLNRSITEVTHRFSHSGFFAFQDTSFPAISPDGRLIAACSAADGAVYCFDTTTLRHAGTANAGDATCVFWGATAAAGGAETFELVTGHRSGVLKFWEASETVNK